MPLYPTPDLKFLTIGQYLLPPIPSFIIQEVHKFTGNFMVEDFFAPFLDFFLYWRRLVQLHSAICTHLFLLEEFAPAFAV
ncbi:predicted protein [Botrytis cinerea T4]|uniref:Uncharacterized protein n=1 Tax=Botryotinia fuckeliana (strain T4) TaxID=999810 RepID=G2XS76_BOTF4|nr:predicted protein [Botrytis cinerea T4]